MSAQARVTRSYADPDWPAEVFTVPVADEQALKTRRRLSGLPFARSGPGWAESDRPEAWTPLGPVPAHVERIDWTPRGVA
jgi:hypothetical protein